MRTLDRILHWIIAIENIGILYDIFFRSGAISWPKIIFLFVSVALLAGVWFFHYKSEKLAQKPEVASTASAVTVNDLLTSATRDAARMRFNELKQFSEFLAVKVPLQDEATAGEFCNFWDELVANWGRNVERIVRQYAGKQPVEDFLSGAGFNPHEPVGNVHPNAADAYRLLLHRQRSLKHINF